MKLHYAQVISLDDSNQKGAIQVRILPEMLKFAERDLPWVYSFQSLGMHATSYSFTPPPEGSFVWVTFLDDYFHEGYYVSGAFIKGLFDYNTIKNDIQSITDAGTQSYPYLQFNLLADGSIRFFNTDTTEQGILHPSGSWFIFDADGNIILDVSGSRLKLDTDKAVLDANGSKITLNNNGDIEIDAGMNNINVTAGLVDIGGTGSQEVLKVDALKTALSSVLALIDTHVHSDPLSGSTGPAPTLTTPSLFSISFSNALDSAKANKLKTL